MALTVDEIKLKLGLDHKDLDEGTRKALMQIANFRRQADSQFDQMKNKIREVRSEFRLFHWVGSFTGLAYAFQTIRNELQQISDLLARIGRSNEAATGDIKTATANAAVKIAQDKAQIAADVQTIENPLAARILAARTNEQRESLLREVLAGRKQAELGYTNYQNRQAARATDITTLESRSISVQKMQAQLDEAKQNLESIRLLQDTSYLEQARAFAQQHGTTIAGAAGALFGPNVSAVASQIFGPAITVTARDALVNLQKSFDSQQAKVESLTTALDKELKARGDLATKLTLESKQYETDKANYKRYDDARNQLTQAIREQKNLQEQYNLQMSWILRRKSEYLSGRVMPGLEELAGYQGPYARVAKEIMMARDLAKRQSAFGTRSELIRDNPSVIGAEREMHYGFWMATSYQGRAKALARYADRLQEVLTGRIKPDQTLAEINQQITMLNQSAQTKGLVVRGAD